MILDDGPRQWDYCEASGRHHSRKKEIEMAVDLLTLAEGLGMSGNGQ